ncbi:MAG: 16S rRNA (adenine(1518)-N(6)/adenine(1519)-N(6))-dimethyltransferase RsmA [Pseudomonadota bacterium]
MILAGQTGHADDGLPPVGEFIRRFELRAKKSLGQNFLLDLNLTRKIAGLCGPLAGQTVIEIGPGPGGLTRSLLFEGADRVVAVERDARCLPALEVISEHWPGRLHVMSGDALMISLSELALLIGDNEHKRFRIISNLPYGIATKLLVGWLERSVWPPPFSSMALMFQREVAERIVAKPGTKAYGRLAVLSQWSCQVAIGLRLPASAFTPPPKVDSAVVTFVPREIRQPEASAVMVGRVTAAVFGQRRKMLRSSLRQLTLLPEQLLEEVGLAPDIRGEQVSVEDFARLAVRLEQQD